MLVVVVMAFAMLTGFVHLLNQLVIGGERTRETWRAAEAEKVMARNRVLDSRANPKAR